MRDTSRLLNQPSSGVPKNQYDGELLLTGWLSKTEYITENKIFYTTDIILETG